MGAGDYSSTLFGSRGGYDRVKHFNNCVAIIERFQRNSLRRGKITVRMPKMMFRKFDVVAKNKPVRVEIIKMVSFCLLGVSY